MYIQKDFHFASQCGKSGKYDLHRATGLFKLPAKGPMSVTLGFATRFG